MLCYLAHSTVIAQDSKYPYIGIVQTEKLRVMPNRGTNYREIAELKQNDLITVINRVGDWLLIKPPENITCWLSSQFIENGVLTGSNVNVRQGPGLNFPVICQISKGDNITVLKTIDNWVQIAPPDSIQAWVNADFVSYFSSQDSLTSTLQRLEESKDLFNQALIYSKSELSKDNTRSINFTDMFEKFYNIIDNFPDTIYAHKALFELESISNQKTKIEAELIQQERNSRVKELFSMADEFAQYELEKRNPLEIEENQIKLRYMSIIKEFPEKEEAKWAIERMSMVRNKLNEAREIQSQDRRNAFDQAEEFRNAELLKDVSDIDFNAITAKYRSIIVLYPDTPEARRAEERIEDIKQRQSYARIKVNPDQKSASSLYAYEGFLMIDNRQDAEQNLYYIEERGFLHKKQLCLFYSNDPNIKTYLNKKVKVEGLITSFNQDDIPILNIKRIQLK
jgi:hypothetical protein